MLSAEGTRGDSRRRATAVASRHPSAGGWTLIELVITLTILTILSLGVVPLVKTSVKRYREYQLREALRTMRTAIKEFHRDTMGAPCCAVQQQSRNAEIPVLIDPRSKVGITDRTIFGVENMDHYPPTLETLVEGVSVAPRASMNLVNANMNANIGDIGKNSNGGGGGGGGFIVSNKKKVYLRAVPVDPMTGKAEWDLRSSYDPPDSSEWGGENVFDVRSKSTATALDGSKYNEW